MSANMWLDGLAVGCQGKGTAQTSFLTFAAWGPLEPCTISNSALSFSILLRLMDATMAPMFSSITPQSLATGLARAASQPRRWGIQNSSGSMRLTLGPRRKLALLVEPVPSLSSSESEPLPYQILHLTRVKQESTIG